MKPAPVPTNVVCRVCGLPWDQHGPDPTLKTCVRLLRAEIDRPRWTPPHRYSTVNVVYTGFGGYE